MSTGYESEFDGAPKKGGECVILHPYLKNAPSGRDPEALLDEGAGLASAIDLTVTHAEVVRINSAHPATLFGKGTIERLGKVIWDENDESEIDIIIIDASISPIQQKNLENTWKRKVIDRTGLILEIFGARAKTREGRLQVALAALSYQRGRLVRSWTHLERQRGGAGFMGGPGETQIETDRRLIDQRITRLKRDLVEVKRTRSLHRSARKRVPYPVVALVGYTNAGKSTLFNRLTTSNVEVKDQLFATLDPTMRRLDLPSGRRIILSDTVGFVSNLPHELVNAFHATLEEVQEADLILHVRDISHPDNEAQKKDVITVLKEIGFEDTISSEMLEVLNKIDLLDPETRAEYINRSERSETIIPVSAVTSEGCNELIDLIDQRITASSILIETSVLHADGATMAWLYDHGEVIERVEGEEATHLKVRLDPVNAERFRQRN